MGGVFDQFLDFLGRRRTALRQRAHFARHHRETTALFTGARGFHRRIQRQNVGLKGNPVDYADDVDDLARAGRDALHRADHAAHHFAAACGDVRRVHGKLARPARVVRVLLDGGGELLHRRRRLFERRGLLFGACRQIGVARGNLLRGRGDRLGARADLRHRAHEAVLHMLHALE